MLNLEGSFMFIQEQSTGIHILHNGTINIDIGGWKLRYKV